MQSYHKHVAHILISLALLLIALTIISRWDTVNGLAGVSPYDVPTPTISSPTIVYDSPNIDTSDTTNNNDSGQTIVSEQNKPVHWGDEPQHGPDDLKFQELPKENNRNEMTDQDIARKERKTICHEMYQEKKEVVINHDKIVERCATMMTLQYAFEAGHGTSRLCREQKNCFGIKENSRDRCIHGPGAFCTYSACSEGMRDYAELFMLVYEGFTNIKSLLNKYDPTHHGEYYHFVERRYDETLQYFINN